MAQFKNVEAKTFQIAYNVWEQNAGKLAEDGVFTPMTNADKWAIIRQERDKLLTACDWTQVSDAPTSITQKRTPWQVYRQKLRDIPQIHAKAADVIWPVPPEK